MYLEVFVSHWINSSKSISDIELKKRLKKDAVEITRIISHFPNRRLLRSKETIEIRRIVEGINELVDKQEYIDEGQSKREFRDTGDELVEMSRELIKKLRWGL